MAHRKGLKQKDIDRLFDLQSKHPGYVTVAERKEKEALEARYVKYGDFKK